MRKILSILLCAILALSLCACSASKQEVSDSLVGSINGAPSYDSSFESGSFAPETDKVVDSIMPESPAEDGTSTSTDDYLQSQKLIYTCNIKMQSKTFENTMQAIKALIVEHNGFVESEKLSDNSYSWYYSDYEKRFFCQPDEIIHTSTDKCVVCTQWGVGNIGNVIARAKELGIGVTII